MYIVCMDQLCVLRLVFLYHTYYAIPSVVPNLTAAIGMLTIMRIQRSSRHGSFLAIVFSIVPGYYFSINIAYNLPLNLVYDELLRQRGGLRLMCCAPLRKVPTLTRATNFPSRP